jgi:hypothetical protein
MSRRIVQILLVVLFVSINGCNHKNSEKKRATTFTREEIEAGRLMTEHYAEQQGL